MRKRIVVVAATIVALAALVAVAEDNSQLTQGRALGTWKLNVKKSNFGQMPAPKSMSLSVTKDTPTALKWTITGTQSDGKPIHESFSGAADGKPYPLVGAPAGTTVAYTTTGKNEVLATMSMKNGGSLKQTITLSDDNKSMTVKAEGNGPNGPMTFTEVWERVGGAATPAAKKPGK